MLRFRALRSSVQFPTVPTPSSPSSPSSRNYASLTLRKGLAVAARLSSSTEAKQRIPARYTITSHSTFAPTLLAPIRSFSSHPVKETTTSSKPVAPASSSITTPTAPVPWKERAATLWEKVKAEGRHYWLGTKLLAADFKIAYHLCRAISQGHELTRRERKRLIRTAGDLVRLVPFIVIIIVPLADFALPVLLKFFPNMLPSTYLDSRGQEAKLQKQLLVKMEYAKFLQEALNGLARQLAVKYDLSTEEAGAQATKFHDFMEKVRTGKKVVNSDIVGFSKLFDSELTLDNLNKEQLVAMCRLLDIKVFGNLWVLRYKLQEKLRQIQKDDGLIQSEGIDALSEEELREACRARGIYTGPDKDVAYLKRKLADWLELSLMHQVPVTLLVLSRAFSRRMTGTAIEKEEDLSEDLATTLAHVPDVVIAEAEKEIIDLSDDKAAKLAAIEEESLELRMEQLKSKKSGSVAESRESKLQPAIGVTTETLAQLEAENDVVEKTIDRTMEKQEQKEQSQAASSAAQPIASTSAVPRQPATLVTSPTISSSDFAVTTAVGGATVSSKDKKTIKTVDRLNDTVGAIIDDVKAKTEALEKMQHAHPQVAASTTKGE